MLNFTVGPVQSPEEICEVGGEQVPYFRTPEFSKLMKENEEWIKQFLNAKSESRVIFLTGSGTAAMEASVINTLTVKDKVLVVNGGGFGQRFAEICSLHCIPFTSIRLKVGQPLSKVELTPYEGKGYTAFLVNLHETSTGVLYDLNLISDFCFRNNLFLIVDAISSFLADPIDMTESKIDIVLTGSQKALACQPGISILTLAPRALQRIANIKQCSSYYFDLNRALKDGERGQTPFTPAVGILRQIHTRLSTIVATGGLASEIRRTKNLAKYFRYHIKKLPFEIASLSLSNALTPLRPLTIKATDLFTILKDQYKIWICPNGGELKDTICRVGHIGNLTTADIDILISALYDMHHRHLL